MCLLLAVAALILYNIIRQEFTFLLYLLVNMLDNLHTYLKCNKENVPALFAAVTPLIDRIWQELKFHGKECVCNTAMNSPSDLQCCCHCLLHVMQYIPAVN